MSKIINRNLFIAIIFYSFTFVSFGQIRINEFISNISKTYMSTEFNDIEYREQILKETLKRQNLSMDSGSYLYIPFFRIEFKDLSCNRRNHMKKKDFFSYLSTKKLEFIEMYVYKDSMFYGTLRMNANNEMYFIQNEENIKQRAIAFYYQIYKKFHPEIMLYIRRPFSEMFVIQNEEINPIRYERSKWYIHSLNVFFDDKRFNYDYGYVKRQHDKLFKWED